MEARLCFSFKWEVKAHSEDRQTDRQGSGFTGWGLEAYFWFPLSFQSV